MSEGGEKMTHIMQGDAYPILLTVRTKDGDILTPDDIKVLEVMIGSILKSYPDSIRWEADTGKFAVPLTQEETLNLTPGVQAVQARALGVNGYVRGWRKCGEIAVTKSDSRTILGGDGGDG